MNHIANITANNNVELEEKAAKVKTYVMRISHHDTMDIHYCVDYNKRDYPASHSEAYICIHNSDDAKLNAAKIEAFKQFINTLNNQINQ